MVDWEVASRCPKCDNPGKLERQRPGPENSTIAILMCETKSCPWFETTWVVQRMSDGTVPDRGSGPLPEREKVFPRQRSGAAMAEQMLEAISKEETIDESPTE